LATCRRCHFYCLGFARPNVSWMNMTVTIAMAVRNGERTVGHAIQSILNQTYENWELIIVDDGSTDSGMDIVASFRDHRIRVIQNDVSQGLSISLNRAIDEGVGDFFARLDVDDVAYPERLKQQVDFLRNDPGVDLVGSRIVVFRDDGVLVGSPKSCVSHDTICANPWKGFYLPHPTWMGRMEWFEKHRYDSRYIKAQDQQLLLRTYRVSRYACLDQVLVGYRQHKIQLGKVLKGRYYFSRALIEQGVFEGRLGLALLAIVEQALKGGVDTLAIVTGMDRRILRHRALPVVEAEIIRWRQVWREVSMEKG